ncbi:PEP-CTERM sorting domain-containing protein [Chitiniphilus purpureus]|uniref:PEP-CTERM sorting domain-containing protein n=1 Tax=Chitiniphilus purpureus TaxID=2981137 RepID=A0ABY6DK52_9NEIS|nr:PEP-CTERM sorting domain-containing protein [Chitiniphilus sp. CD1]UXY14744.1 PEP-CTERM sorting domain-containing protein [Chitiniphilus sp. CD1]
MSMRYWLALGGLLYGSVASAQLTTVEGRQVKIDYDADRFTFLTFDYQNKEQYFQPKYRTLENGIALDFNAFRLDHTVWQPDDPGRGMVGYYDAYFAFRPKSGYRITGYEAVFSGHYQIESAGRIDFKQIGQPTVQLGAAGGMRSFNHVVHFEGADSPLLNGNVTAVARAYESFAGAFAGELAPGRVQFELQEIALKAVLSPVPEPASGLLLLLGGGALGWRHRRRAKVAAAR